MRKPDFEQLLNVLSKAAPDRPTLFEFFLNDPLYQRLCGYRITAENRPQAMADAFAAAGYDYCTTAGYGISFPKADRHSEKSISLNEGAMITSWDEYENYPWPDADAADYSVLNDIRLPDGMKIIVHGPCGVLENTIQLVGYDNLCMMVFDQPDLVKAIADRIGGCLLNHYRRCLEFDRVGAAISNDDWGFQQQPMLSPEDMRNDIVPWHKKIVEAIHAAGRPAIMHSCGNVFDCGLIDDVIDVCKYDARHSYEDKILPVEKAWQTYHDRIAVLGGIDLDFLCRKSPGEIRERADRLLELTSAGGYALGSGNSIPEYVPVENYFAMISAATGMDYSGFLK